MQLTQCLGPTWWPLLMHGMSYVQYTILNQTAQYGFWDRFHQIPPFGKGSICQFPSNVTEACQCAARHFEDLLQVGYVGDWYALFGLTFGPVCYARIRGFISSWTWSGGPNSTLSIGTMACPCKVVTSHGPFPRPAQWSYSATWGSVVQIPGLHLCCLQDYGATIRDCSTVATKGTRPWYYDNTLWILCNQCPISCMTEVLQPNNLQTPCSGWLCSQHLPVWNNRLLYNTTGKRHSHWWISWNWVPEWLTDTNH